MEELHLFLEPQGTICVMEGKVYISQCYGKHNPPRSQYGQPPMFGNGAQISHA